MSDDHRLLDVVTWGGKGRWIKLVGGRNHRRGASYFSQKSFVPTPFLCILFPLLPSLLYPSATSKL